MLEDAVFLVYDLQNLSQHELFEAWSTEAGAKRRCEELNGRPWKEDEFEDEFDSEEFAEQWIYREVAVDEAKRNLIMKIREYERSQKITISTDLEQLDEDQLDERLHEIGLPSEG
jgi:hypothetical protein